MGSSRGAKRVISKSACVCPSWLKVEDVKTEVRHWRTPWIEKTSQGEAKGGVWTPGVFHCTFLDACTSLSPSAPCTYTYAGFT